MKKTIIFALLFAMLTAGLTIIFVVLTIMSCSPDAGRPTDRFKDRATLSEATGVEFPEFKVVKHHRGEASIHGDYGDEIEAEFLVEPDSTFYKSIEELAELNAGEGGWYVDEDGYHFNWIWGNGFKAPKGQNDEDDFNLEIKLIKGWKDFHISCGRW